MKNYRQIFNFLVVLLKMKSYYNPDIKSFECYLLIDKIFDFLLSFTGVSEYRTTLGVEYNSEFTYWFYKGVRFSLAVSKNVEILSRNTLKDAGFIARWYFQ